MPGKVLVSLVALFYSVLLVQVSPVNRSDCIVGANALMGVLTVSVFFFGIAGHISDFSRV
jgi:hypothetical protein